MKAFIDGVNVKEKSGTQTQLTVNFDSNRRHKEAEPREDGRGSLFIVLSPGTWKGAVIAGLVLFFIDLTERWKETKEGKGRRRHTPNKPGMLNWLKDVVPIADSVTHTHTHTRLFLPWSLTATHSPRAYSNTTHSYHAEASLTDSIVFTHLFTRVRWKISWCIFTSFPSS